MHCVGSRKRRVMVALAAAVLLGPSSVCMLSAPARSDQTVSSLRSVALAAVEGQVEGAFADVAHIRPPGLGVLLDALGDRVVLVDVRTQEEFARSHLPGAVRVSPEARGTAELVAAVGSLEGKVVVFYCSIGLRSSRLMVRIGQALREKGAAQLYNLSGGIFRWRNEHRPLVAEGSPTNAIHAYNPLWRQFLIDDP
jgi:rhodanese-related sulfurtransferase